MEQTKVVQSPGSAAGQINWTVAVFVAAVVGGIAYGLLASSFGSGESMGDGLIGWLPMGIVIMTMLLVGVPLTVLGKTTELRTAAASLAIAPLAGGPIVLEIFVGWLVNQYG